MSLRGFDLPRATAAFVDDVVRDALYACRSFGRTPLVTVTIVTTVGIGLGLVAVVFTILNAYVFRVDEVRAPHELFAVGRQQSVNTPFDGFTREDYDALVRETDLFSDTFATTHDVSAWIDGSRREGRLVTGNFFQALGVGAARGRTLTPSDDETGAGSVIVLSHRAWTQHFASDPGVVGRTVRVNGSPADVVGVMPAGFRGLLPFASPDFWAPLSHVEQFRPPTGTEDSGGLEIIGRLKPGVSPGQGLAQLLAWDSLRTVERANERSPTSLTLEPSPGTMPLSVEVLALIMPLFFAFGLILMIGCANVANLLLARGIARQREIGIRLAIGASRRRLVAQLLTESLVLALLSAALAFVISRLVLGGVVHAVINTFPPEIGNLRLAMPPADWRLVLFLVGGATASTLLFALLPTLQTTRPELSRTMHGEVVSNIRPSRSRNALVGLQVTGSVLLLICAAIFLRSSWAAATVDPGIRTTGILNASVLNEERRRAILDTLESEPSVVQVAASWPGFMGGLGGLPAFAEGGSNKSTVTYQFVSPEYFGILGIDLLRGRAFGANERSQSAAVAVVSETVAHELWPNADPIGQVLRMEPTAPGELAQRPVPDDPLLQPRTAVVVGVTRAVAGFRLGSLRLGATGVYLPIGTETPTTSLTMTVRGDSERARFAIVDRLAAIDPNAAQVSTLQTVARAEAYLLAIPLWLTSALGALALFLTVSGLFSVLSYAVEQRAREIGVRTALGATRGRVGALVLSQSARPVGTGLLLGSSLSAALGAVLLATPAAELIGSSVLLFDPLAYVASVLCVAAVCACAALVPALRAGRIDPVAALRQD
jgi:predicted permease